MIKLLKVLFIGDIVGNPGRKTAAQMISELKKEENFDCCIANGENSAGGSGITYVVAKELYESGIDALTLGNHAWSKKEIFNFIDSDDSIIRPANYPEGVPGRGSMVLESEKGNLGIINLQGRVFMENIDCPFSSADREIERVKKHARMIIVDMHAEATSEKTAMAWYLDGRVSCVLGTHTHVQTSDERILPFGTGYITDVGMTGPYEGILGVKKDIITKKFLTHLPARHEVEKGVMQFNAVIVEIDERTGKTLKIIRILKILT